MLSGILNVVSMVLLIYDTLGYIANYSKKEDKDNVKEDNGRLLHTWIFYFSIKTISCYTCCCEGYLSGILSLVVSIALLLLVLPITGVSGILTQKIVNEQFFCNMVCKLKGMTGCCEGSTSCGEKEKTGTQQ